MAQCVINKIGKNSYSYLFLVIIIVGDTMYYYLNIFFINSFLGFLLETGLKTFLFHGMNNGILFGPWIPVYGLGAVIITFVSHKIFRKLSISKLWKTVLLFITVFFLLSLLEWLGGILIEKLFHKVFWDYSDQKFHLGPYISLGMSLIWSFASLLFVYVILPLENKIIKKIPKGLSISLFVLISIDFLFTFLLT